MFFAIKKEGILCYNPAKGKYIYRFIKGVTMDIYMFFSVPGGGKTTQIGLTSAYLQECGYSIKVVKMGDCVRRKLADPKNLLQQALKERYLAGDLLPVAVPVSILQEEIWDGEYDVLLTDGVGRCMQELRVVRELFATIPNSRVHIIHLTISEQEMEKRLIRRGREDDTDASVTQRMRRYDRETSPVLLQLCRSVRKSDDIHSFNEVDGSGTEGEVQGRILSIADFPQRQKLTSSFYEASFDEGRHIHKAP